MNVKLNTVIAILESYALAAKTDGYRDGCIMSSFELDRLVNMLREAKAENLTDLIRAPG